MGSLNNFLAARRPVARYVTYVLSNGASLRLPIAIQQAGPRFASMDLYNHILWKNKIETEASLEAAKDILPDMSDYYAKFGMGGGGAARPARGGPKGRAMPARQ